MPRLASIIAALATILCSGCANTAAASAAQGEPTPSHGGTITYVDAARGNDRGPGTKARPLRTVIAAWNRIPQGRTLTHPYTIVLEPGRGGAAETPNYWQLRWGTPRAVVTIRAASPSTATLPAVNMFSVRWLVID